MEVPASADPRTARHHTTPSGLWATVQHAEQPGLPVVVVHGGMDRSLSFGRVARHLASFPLVRYDRRGYGRSLALAPVSLDQQVDDLLELIGSDEAVLFGHSIGGVIALAAAHRHPERIRGVLAFEAPTPWSPWWPGPPRVPAAAPDDPADEAEAFLRSVIGDRMWDRLPASTRAERRAEGPALRADKAAIATTEPPFDAAAITVPVLVGFGAETTWWHRRAAEELAAAVPSAELAEVPGATHGVHLSHPTATAELVERIHRRATGGASGSAPRR